MVLIEDTVARSPDMTLASLFLANTNVDFLAHAALQYLVHAPHNDLEVGI
jgi:hypothetical protein